LVFDSYKTHGISYELYVADDAVTVVLLMMDLRAKKTRQQHERAGATALASICNAPCKLK